MEEYIAEPSSIEMTEENKREKDMLNKSDAENNKIRKRAKVVATHESEERKKGIKIK